MRLNDLGIGAARRKIAHILDTAGIERSLLEADIILSSLLHTSRARLLAHPEIKLNESDLDRLEEVLLRRSRREPLQYILGHESFWGRDFLVGPGTLVPRPETEFLVEAALQLFKGGYFLDWGTGSGCIALTILMERTSSSCVAAEKNPRAIKWTWQNLKKYSLEDRCLLWHSRIPEDIPLETDLDLIISNPPYIREHEIAGLMPEVGKYEPVLALNGGKDGLDPYRILLPWASKHLKRGGHVIVEIGDDLQARELSDWEISGLKQDVEVRDLAGISRVVGWCRV